MTWLSYLMGFAAEARRTKGKSSVDAGFYVYAHFEGDTGELFYIGKGHGRRAWDRQSRNRIWRAIVAVHDRRVAIIKSGLTEPEALNLEAEIIQSVGQGVLACLTLGGGGITGYRHTATARLAMSLKRSGRKISEENRARLSESIRSRPDLLEQRRASFSGDNNPSRRPEIRKLMSDRMKSRNPMAVPDNVEKMRQKLIGRTISAEARAKQSATLTGRKRGPMQAHVRAAIASANEIRKRPVITACGLRFESTLSAAKSLGIRQGNIVNNCAGRAKSAGGYSWSYAHGSR